MSFYLYRTILRYEIKCPLSSCSRQLSSSAIVRRDLYARYRRQVSPQGIAVKDEEGDNRNDTSGFGEVNAFKTVATTPAATSFQDVPAPNQTVSKVRTALPIPAMSMTDETKSEAKKTEGKEIIVQGVVVPQKPRPPTEEGCVNCIYNIYADELEVYTSALADARDALMKVGIPERDWPKEVQKVQSQGAEGMIESAKEEVKADMDPVMAAFLALEGKLKKKQGHN